MADFTFSQLGTRVRERCDMENNNFITDSELVNYINASAAELHDILIQAYGDDYYIKTKEFNTTSGVSLYPISDSTSSYDLAIGDFYKVRGVDAKLNGSEYFTLEPFNFNERNLYANFGSWSMLGVTNVRYRLVGDNVMFTPEPDGVKAVKIWYIPTADKFTYDSGTSTASGTISVIHGYEEFIVLDAAIKCLQKEESDVTTLVGQKFAMNRRIEEAANNRDAGSPLSVSDVYNENNRYWWGTTRT